MSQRRTRTRRSSGGNRGRSWQVPLSVAVIAISAIAIWQLSSGLFDDEPSPREPVPEITAFWTESGRDLLTDWRTTSPDIVQDLATGVDCFPDVEIMAAVCPDLPEHYDGYRLRVQALIARADGLATPADSTAEEWLTELTEAWTNLDAALATYAQIGRDGYDRSAWEAEQASYREQVIASFDEGEFALARMLIEVDPVAISGGAN